MTVKVKVSGAWKDSTSFMRVSGAWKQVITWVKRNGVWTKVDAPTQKPTVTLSPSSVTTSIALYHTFHADFSGDDLTFQWFEDGVPISGATDKDYGFLPKADDHGKSYYCEARNSEGVARTSSALLSLRHRIYFNSSIWAAFESSDTVKLVFKDDGFIDVVTSERTFTNMDTWIGANAGGTMPSFNLSEYKVRISKLSANMTIVGGSIGTEFTTMTNGCTIEVNITSLNVGQSSYFDITFQDSVLPDFNWAGWDNGNVFVRRLAPPEPPNFVSHPSNRTVTEGQRASFRASATGDVPISYQWQYNTGSYWRDWRGMTNSTLSFTTSMSHNGWKIRCKATNPAGTGYSSIATLRVNAAPKPPRFTRNPSSQTVSAGSKANFTVSASGDSPMSYQWEHKKPTSSVWSKWSGKTSTTLSFTTSASNDGWKVRCKATNPVGSAYSSIATLNVN